jgi:hypothetical protein
MLAKLRQLFKPFVPEHVDYRRSRGQSPGELFAVIYREKHWGGEDYDFYSGSGSHTPNVIEPFIAAVRAYLSAFPAPPIVVDLGCGDFAAGERLVDLARHYYACDVVPELIVRNCRLFTRPNVSFHLLDAVTDPLPHGDVVIVKQVFQHLCNEQIAAIVRKLSHYPAWIITEHVPVGEFTPNRDKLTSGYSRLPLNSGIVLTEKPFRVKPKATEVLSEVPEDGNLIRTVAYRF